MKSIKSIPLLAAAVLLVAACNNNEDLAPKPDNFPADGVMRVATRVDDPRTRAGMNTENLTDFSLRVVNEANPDYCYYTDMNKRDGNWAAYEPTGVGDAPAVTMLWQNKTQPVKVTAVRNGPGLVDKNEWTTNTRLNIAENQSEANYVEDSDVLYMAEKTVDPAKDLTTDGKISISFKHRLSKLHLTLKLGTEMNLATPEGTQTNPVSELKVQGSVIRKRWNLNTNELSAIDDQFWTKPVTPFLAAYTAGEADTKNAEAKYECILIPQEIAAGTFSIAFKIGSKVYKWTSTEKINLEADTRYNLTLTAGKDAVSVEGFSAKAWTDGGTTNAETE